MDNQPEQPITYGAPKALADAEEVPGWFANLVMTVMAAPMLLGFLCGGIPLLMGICFCIAQLFLL